MHMYTFWAISDQTHSKHRVSSKCCYASVVIPVNQKPGLSPTIALQVAKQSPLTYLQKFASQPVPQLPTPQVVQQQFLPASAQQGSTSGSKPAGQSQQNGSKGSLDTAPGAGGHKALQLPLLRPAPPVLKPFAGVQSALHAA